MVSEEGTKQLGDVRVDGETQRRQGSASVDRGYSER